MKLAALRLYNVKRFARQGVAIEGIGDGVNVLCAANEYGKSTSFEALHALFFLPHTSVAKDVQRLKPYSGGNPIVQAEIEVAQGRFRLTKQFLGGKRAQVERLDGFGGAHLVAQADEAEGFIAGLIRGGSAGPAGLLWVRQGITGLEERKKSEEEDERRVRESLLASVQGEVEAITGGRRMSQIMAACEEELGRLVTATLRPKGGGPYAAAAEEEARLNEEERRLAAEVRALREALDRRAGALKRLAELGHAEEKAARRAAVEQAEAAFEAAKAHAQKLKAAEAEAALARERRDAAVREVSAFREALEQAGRLGGELEAAHAAREEARARRGVAVAAIEQANAAVVAAESEEQAIRDLLGRLDAALRARQAAEELSALDARLRQGEALRAGLEQGEAALALIAIADAAVDGLQLLDIEIARLRAAEEAALPTLRMAYAPTAGAPLVLDGAPLSEGEERPIRDLSELDIPGIGTLTLRSHRPDGADRARRAAERKRADQLATLGVADLAEARGRQAAARAKSAELDGLRLELRHVAPDGLARLREEVARRAALAPEVLELKADPEETRLKLAQAGLRVGAARNGVREAQPQQGRANDAFVATEAAVARLNGELARLDAFLGDAAERPARAQLLAQAREEREALFARHEALAVALRQAAPHLPSAEAALRRAKSAEDAAAQEEGRLGRELAELNGQIRTRADDAVEEAWRETAEALEAARGRVRAFAAEVAALDRLRATLQASRSAARDLYLKPVLTELRPLLGLLFEDISIVFDEKSLLPQTIRRNGQDEEIDRLSGGMREQLSVLTRLAFARLLARDGRPAPVILDDALVYSDDDRIERMFNALHLQARDQQILVFSCRQRAFSRLGGNVLAMTPWQPETA
ncbi:AAA family ATPase [Ancylobacter amanitiformis]|uniref:DNA repair exonuclease SbcCD ATPase subunit n=1 Tax=Ancylobacter amanitiformis TaxID=217069 RepID=A0ABU0LU78_9HYPH|nr:DNA-binding protein [Ancylobacter amanitiformis]MDQ0512258.1 DNA repair exonuclease SbcCD ATPase subunit [Ancylobacter amanitiformis]